MIQIDMPLPNRCNECPFASAGFYNGVVSLSCITPTGRSMYAPDLIDRKDRPAWCPLKERDSLLGIQQTADSITFISTGTAQQGEERGILLGKSLMHEWIYKELLHKGLLTDDIRSVFEQAKRIP